ncbi:MAG: hypothetical protein GY757_26180 [bacterium]|nr:hypothetical protein [bacterium]
MGLGPKKDNQKFTYADYQSWDDGERWEIIDGLFKKPVQDRSGFPG